MKVTETKLKGCFIIDPRIIKDNRGYFFETFNQRNMDFLGKSMPSFVQDNESCSSRGVLRGLHYQKGEHAQAKLLRVVKGTVLDVVVDLRTDSKTFGQSFSTILSGDNKKQLYVPRGFAHGFLVLEDETIFSYKCDNFYNKDSEAGIIYNDPEINIDWGFPEEEMIISQKDKMQPTLRNASL